MANEKFLGDWQYHFMTIDEKGKIDTKPKGRFHINTIDGNGKFTDAKDDDTKPLTGGITKEGQLEVVRISRADAPKRHLRGVLAFEGVINGVFCMVLVGERRGNPFPVPFAPDRSKTEKGEKEEKEFVAGQEDGTWIATKP